VEQKKASAALQAMLGVEQKKACGALQAMLGQCGNNFVLYQLQLEGNQGIDCQSCAGEDKAPYHLSP